MTQHRLAHAVPEVDRSNPADGQRLVGSLGPPPRRRRQPQRQRAAHQVIERAPGRGRRRRRRQSAGDRARGPQRMAHDAQRAQRALPDADREAASPEAVICSQLAVQLLIRLFGAGERRSRVLSASCSRARSAAVRASASSIADRQGIADRSRTRIARIIMGVAGPRVCAAPDLRPAAARTAAPVTAGCRSRATCSRATSPRAWPSAGVRRRGASAGRPRRDRDRPRPRPACRARSRARASRAGRGARKLLSSVMKSRLPEYAVAITGFPRLIDSSIVRPNPSDRCGEK